MKRLLTLLLLITGITVYSQDHFLYLNNIYATGSELFADSITVTTSTVDTLRFGDGTYQITKATGGGGGGSGTDSIFKRSLLIILPEEGEEYTWFIKDVDFTIDSIRAVITVTAGSPSIDFTIRFAKDRGDAGTEVVTGGTTIDTGVGDDEGLRVSSFNDATIPADNWVWVELSNQTANAASLNITIYCHND